VKVLFFSLTLILVLSCPGAFGSEDPVDALPKIPTVSLLPSEPYGFIEGYTSDVTKEMSSEPREMVLMQKPEFLEKPELNKVIFNQQLSDEFIFRYKQQFGFTEQEQNYFLVSQQGYYMSPTGLTATQDDTARQQFAQYMIKRLAEWHADNILKNDPDFKPVYDLKQKVGNYKVDVGPQSKLDMNYSFIGNFGNIVYTTPWGTTRAAINMDPGSYLPGTPTEVLVLYTRPVIPTVRVETSYACVAQSYRLMFEKRLTKDMTTNISETIYLDGNVVDVDKAELTMLGFNWTF
jgi:hypothetical protein